MGKLTVTRYTPPDPKLSNTVAGVIRMWHGLTEALTK